MKKGLLISAAVAFGLQVFAQGVGIEAGVSMNSLRTDVHGLNIHSSLRQGLRAGIVADEYLSNKLSFQYGVFYNAKGGGVAFNTDFYVNGSAAKQDTRGFLRIDYLEVPLYILYNRKQASGNRFIAGAGPFVAMALGGLISFERDIIILGNGNGNGNHQRRIRSLYPASIGGDPLTDEFTRFDAGVNIQAAYELAKGFFARVHVSYGFLDVDPTADKLGNQGFGLTLGYMIR